MILLITSYQHLWIDRAMTFAEHLRRFRVDLCLSQRDLARLAGLHAITLVRPEAGATAPSTRTVRALAVALGVKPPELTSPDELAELRRVLKNSARSPAKDSS